MRVLFYLRNDAHENLGGDVRESLLLQQAFEELGHEVIPDFSGLPADDDLDVLHIFNIDRAADLALTLRANKTPSSTRVVFTPNGSDYPLPWTLSRVVMNIRSVLNLLRKQPTLTPPVVPGIAYPFIRNRVNGLVFHTKVEETRFRRAFPDWKQPAIVIPPPVALEEPDDSVEERLLPLKPYVAVVGRIEPLKNQCWIVESGLEQRLNIVFVGGTNPKRPRYVKRFKRLIDDHQRCTWLGALHPAGVSAVLSHALIHVSASLRENFGLATAEALAAGCPAAAPADHFIHEMLGSHLVRYSLRDPASLMDAVASLKSSGPCSSPVNLAELDPLRVATRLQSFYASLISRSPGNRRQ